MTRHEGRCLCGRVRYAALAAPRSVTVCHCRFCQRATGGPYMVEPIFDKQNFTLLEGAPRTFDLASAGSGKTVHVHFCADCGTNLWLSFERFPEIVGVYAGTFDDPCWFPIEPATSKHIFLGVARADTIVPAGIPTYVDHATTNDGTPEPVTVYDKPHRMGPG